jgi:hypothetical protein
MTQRALITMHYERSKIADVTPQFGDSIAAQFSKNRPLVFGVGPSQTPHDIETICMA